MQIIDNEIINVAYIYFIHTPYVHLILIRLTIFSLPQLKTQLTRCTFKIEQNDFFIYYLQKTIIHITVHVTN